MTDKPQGPTTGLTPHLTIGGKRAAEAIDFYKKAFGAEEQTRMPAKDGGRLMHAHLLVNGASLMLADDWPEMRGGAAAPPPAGVALHLQVEDTDRWFKRAVAAGASASMKPENMFWGDRYGQVTDPFGHTWAFGSPVKES